MSETLASVIVLAGDDAGGLEVTLESLRRQTAPPGQLHVLRAAAVDVAPRAGRDDGAPGPGGHGLQSGTDDHHGPEAAPLDGGDTPLVVLRAGQSLADDVLATALQRASGGRRVAFRPVEQDQAGAPGKEGAPLEFAALRAFEAGGARGAATSALACWLAAAEAGAGRDGCIMIAACVGAAPPSDDAEADVKTLVQALVEGLALGTGRPPARLLSAWEAFWPRLWPALEMLESALHRPGLSRRLAVRLERRLLPSRLEGRTALAFTLAVPIDPATLAAIEPAPGCDTLLLEFVDANLALCRLERPLWGRVAAHELAALLEERLGTEELMRRARFERHAKVRFSYRFALLRSAVRALPARLSLDPQRRAFAGPHLLGNLHWASMQWLRLQETAGGTLGSVRAAAILDASLGDAMSAGAAPASRLDMRSAQASPTGSALPDAIQSAIAAAAADLARQRPVDHLPVLAYGRILEGEARRPRDGVPAAHLEAQLALLQRHGGHVPTLEALLAHRRSVEPLQGRPVFPSFDGGLENFLAQAWPRLQRHGLRAHVFVTPEELPRDAEGRKRLRALAAAGIGFGLRLPDGHPADGFGSEALLRWAAGAIAALRETLGPVPVAVALDDSCGPREWHVLTEAGCALLFQGDGLSVAWDTERPLRRLRVEGGWDDERFASALRLNAPEPLVSVVVPAYNAAATIDATLDSVRSQTYRRLEILVVDDGSTDDTAARVERHAAADPRVRLLRQSNGGVAAARNLGLRASRGDYVAPVDADDLWHPHKIERQVRMFEHGPPTLGLVYTWYAVIDAEGGVVRGGRPSLGGAVQPDLMRIGNFVGNASSALMRRELALRFGYDASLRERGGQGCEDYKLYLELAGVCSFAAVPGYLTGYRVVDGNMSSAILTMHRSTALVLEEFAAREPAHAALLRRGETVMLAWLAQRGLECGRLDDARTMADALEPLDAPLARWIRRRAVRMAVERVVQRWGWGRALFAALRRPPRRPPFPIGRPG